MVGLWHWIARTSHEIPSGTSTASFLWVNNRYPVAGRQNWLGNPSMKVFWSENHGSSCRSTQSFWVGVAIYGSEISWFINVIFILFRIKMDVWSVYTSFSDRSICTISRISWNLSVFFTYKIHYISYVGCWLPWKIPILVHIDNSTPK